MSVDQKLNLLLSKVTQLDRFILQKQGEHRSLLSLRDNLTTQVETESQKAVLFEKVSLVVQKLSELSRVETLDKVATIVTVALQDIKDPSLSFKINYTVERGQPVADFVIHDSKLQMDLDIMNSCGGTLADLVELPLKVSLLLKWQPRLAKILILDESFKHVSAADRPALANFIRQLSEKLGLQIILVTHSTELASHAHRVFSVHHNGKSSEVKLEKSSD